jgi:predicted 3-demethylubiquinone-9 3-methyltransferase (glyoxalase superfamily)
MTEQRKVRTCFWFTRRGIDAAQFYVGLVPDSRIDAVFDHGRPDDPLIVEFSLAGAPMMILTGGEMFGHSPAASISVLTKDQAETDRLWSALLADGGRESMCGWLVDGFGVSWQIVPEVLPRLLNDPDTAAASRTRAAMMRMKKIDIAALETAFHSA